MKILFILLSMSILSTNLQAQTLREKMQAKLNEVKGGEGGGSSSSEMPSEGQLEIAKRWESGDYTMYQESSGMMARKGAAHIRIIKDEDGNVTSVRLGQESSHEMESEAYNPYRYGGTDFVCAFFRNNANCLYFTDDMIVHYSCDSDYKVKNIDWALKSKKKARVLIAEIQEYRDFGGEKIESDRLRIKEDEIANRAKFTLEGKEVTEIKAIFPNGKPSFVKTTEKIAVGFELTLSDGTTMKTSNIGGNAYVEDLVEEGVNGRLGIGGTYITASYGGNPMTRAFVNASLEDVSKDYIEITVKPKYGGSGSCTIKLPIKYPTEVSAYFSGMSGSSTNSYEGVGGDGADAGEVIAEVKTTKHSETGETLYLCRVSRKGSSDKTIYKMSMGGTFTIHAIGGSGGEGGPGHDKSQYDGYEAPSNGGPGGDGGNGGNIIVYIDPSAEGVQVEGKYYGGAGGVGGTKGICFSCSYGSSGKHGTWGSEGSMGSFRKEIKAVNF